MDIYKRHFFDHLPIGDGFFDVETKHDLQSDLYSKIMKELRDWICDNSDSNEAFKIQNLMDIILLAQQILAYGYTDTTERGANELMKILPSIACNFVPEGIVEKFDELSQLHVKGYLSQLELADFEYNQDDMNHFEALGIFGNQLSEYHELKYLDDYMPILHPDTQIGVYTFQEIIDWATS